VGFVVLFGGDVVKERKKERKRENGVFEKIS